MLQYIEGGDGCGYLLWLRIIKMKKNVERQLVNMDYAETATIMYNE